MSLTRFKIARAVTMRLPEIVPHLSERARLFALKAYAFYASSVRDLTKKFYDGRLDYTAFVDSMENLVISQLRIAWFEGMEANGLTEDDMTTEWAAMLREIIMSEQDHIPDFALAIEKARRAESPIAPLMSRADMWGNRYNDVVNQAKVITAEKGQKLEWVYGDTDHCETCLSLNGIVAYASEWAASPYHPQQPPNDYLDCGGWRCKCQLRPTKKRRTKNVAEILGL